MRELLHTSSDSRFSDDCVPEQRVSKFEEHATGSLQPEVCDISHEVRRKLVTEAADYISSKVVGLAAESEVPSDIRTSKVERKISLQAKNACSGTISSVGGVVLMRFENLFR